jgi:hypothetical protein
MLTVKNPSLRVLNFASTVLAFRFRKSKLAPHFLGRGDFEFCRFLMTASATMTKDSSEEIEGRLYSYAGRISPGLRPAARNREAGEHSVRGTARAEVAEQERFGIDNAVEVSPHMPAAGFTVLSGIDSPMEA